MNHEHELIQQPLSEQRADESGTSRDPNVLAGHLFELGDFGGEIVLDERYPTQVSPRDLVQCRRYNIFGDAVDMARIRFVARIGPVRCPFLIGHAPEEHRILGVQMCGHCIAHILIKDVELPLVGRFDDAVE